MQTNKQGESTRVPWKGLTAPTSGSRRQLYQWWRRRLCWYWRIGVGEGLPRRNETQLYNNNQKKTGEQNMKNRYRVLVSVGAERLGHFELRPWMCKQWISMGRWFWQGNELTLLSKRGGRKKHSLIQSKGLRRVWFEMIIQVGETAAVMEWLLW